MVLLNAQLGHSSLWANFLPGYLDQSVGGKNGVATCLKIRFYNHSLPPGIMIKHVFPIEPQSEEGFSLNAIPFHQNA